MLKNYAGILFFMFACLMVSCGKGENPQSNPNSLDGELILPILEDQELHQEEVRFSGYAKLVESYSIVDMIHLNSDKYDDYTEVKKHCFAIKTDRIYEKTWTTINSKIITKSISYNFIDAKNYQDRLYFFADCTQAVGSEIHSSLMNMDASQITREFTIRSRPDSSTVINPDELLMDGYPENIVFGWVSIDSFMMREISFPQLCGLLESKGNKTALPYAVESDHYCSIKTEIDHANKTISIVDIVPTYFNLTKDTKSLEGLIKNMDHFGRGTLLLENGIEVLLSMGAHFVTDQLSMKIFEGKKVQIEGFFTKFEENGEKAFMYESLITL